MKLSQLGWACWAVLPVAGLAFHFGPGQTFYAQDQAAKVQRAALNAESKAMVAQELAYQAHLAGIQARREAFLSEDTTAQASASEATRKEDQAYQAAAAEWQVVADSLQQVQDVLGETAPEYTQKVRWAKARALVRTGDVWGGASELETLVDELDAAEEGKGALATAAREELATAYYYGARLLRLSGMPPQEWMVESGKARQHFRYLAEQGEAGEASEVHQRNLELVLNLEQSTLVELQGKPLPKESPKAGKMDKRGMCKNPGRKPKPEQDARGSGGPEQIPEGW